MVHKVLEPPARINIYEVSGARQAGQGLNVSTPGGSGNHNVDWADRSPFGFSMLAESLASQKPALSSSLTKGVVTIQGGDTPLHHLGMLSSGRNNGLGHSPMGYPAPSPW